MNHMSKELMICSDCGGKRVEVWFANNIQITEKPYSFLAKYYSNLKAILCTNCGLLTTYAANPSVFKNLLEEPKE